jgi:predicted PurR-regulated permease PerM
MHRLESLSRASVVVIGVVALVAALDQVESIFAPLALALVAGVVLSPVSDAWEKIGFPPVWGALTSLLLTLVLAGGLILVLQPVVAQLVDQAPKVWSDMRETIAALRGMVQGLRDATGEVAQAISPSGPANAGAESPPADEMALPSLTDALLFAPTILAQIMVFAGTLFFFLLTRTEIYSWAASRLAEPSERARTASRLRQAERRVSRYFLTITLINAGLGIFTAIALQLIGLPGAVLWGLVAFLMNFILYLGPALVAVSLLFAGVAAFDGIAAALPAVSFLALNATEGQFVTPTMVGRHMSLNPLLVFLSLIFGIWLWGPIGGIVAIPLLLWVLVLNDALPKSSRSTS